MKNGWKKIPCSLNDLNIDVVFRAGQSFRWQKKGNEWKGVLSGHVWSLKQDCSGNLLYFVHTASNNGIAHRKTKAVKHYSRSFRSKMGKEFSECSSAQSNDATDFQGILNDYFQFHVNLRDLYDKWSMADSHFKDMAGSFPGVRILRQDPTENLISFICSANNNIPRITGMIEKLCSTYGKEILVKDDQSYYNFPCLEDLACDNVEQELRTMGFGYRAKFINQAAKYILEKHPPGWLESLRRLPYEEAHNCLTQLPGVGSKVADCVCLMSLDKLGAIPVDTHVWQITLKDYLPHLRKTKSLTDRVYKEIGDFYRERFGEYAGWANTVLFAADLRQFKHLSNEEK